MQTTRVVQVGTVSVGGDAPVSVQSMTNTDTRDVEATRAVTLFVLPFMIAVVRSLFPQFGKGSISRLLQTCILTIALLF